MEKQAKWPKIVLKVLSYVSVALLGSVLTLTVVLLTTDTKLNVLQSVLEQCFIGETDRQKLQDAAANAMVEALVDREL